jgi:hypothetical protein
MKKIIFLIAFIAIMLPGLIIAQTNNWTGATSSYWGNAGNWSLSHVPTSAENVVIPTGTSNPKIQLGNAVCNNLTIESGRAILLYGKTMTLDGDLIVFGEVRLLNDASVLNVIGNVFMRSGSTALITKDQAKIQAYGNWSFYSGANANFGNGFVDFKGSGTAIITCNSANSSFYKIRVYKTLQFSNSSTENMVVNNFTFISSGYTLESWSNHDMIFKGIFNYYGTFDFTKGSNTGSVVFDGVDMNKLGSGSGVFNNLEFNSSTGSNTNADITVEGDLTIQSGYFDCGNNDVYLEGHWKNYVGPSGFVPGSGTVTFTSLSGYQNIEGYYGTDFNDINIVADPTSHLIQIIGNITANNVTLNEHSHFRISADEVTINGTLNMNSYCEFRIEKGGATPAEVYVNSVHQSEHGIVGCHLNAILNVNDLVENGIYGRYHAGSGTTINISQNSGGNFDLNGELEIDGGTINLIGSGTSRWPYLEDATIAMTDGTLDMTNIIIVIFNGASSLTDDITGGVIRTQAGFLGYRSDFTPTAGTFEFYGSSDKTIQQYNGGTLYNVTIDKSAKDGSKSNTISLGTDFEVTNDLNVTSGTLDLNNYDMTIGNNLTIGSDAALQIRDNSLTVNNSTYIYGELEMLHDNAVLNAMSHIGWMLGSTANITAYSAKINVYGNWTFNNGADVNLTNGFVDFKGTTDNFLTSYSSNSSFYKLRCNKTSGGKVKVSSNCTQDVVINNFLYIANGAVMESWSDYDIELTGNFNYFGNFDFTKSSNTGSFVFDGSDINQFSAGSGVFNNVVFNSTTGSTTNADLDINGDLTIEAGNFDCDNHTIYVEGDWTNNVGDAGFLEGNGLVVFNGANTADINTNETFYDLSVNKSYTGINGLELDNNIAVHVKHHLQITDGTLEMNQNSSLDIDGDLTIGTGNGLNADDSGAAINIAGQWTDGNVNITPTQGFYPGLSTVVFDGTGDQVVSASAPEEKFGYLLVQKPSGSFKPNNNIYVNMDMALNDGNWADNVNGLSHYFERNFIVNSNGYFDVSTNKNTVYMISDKDADIHIYPSSGIFNELVIDKSATKGSSPKGNNGPKSQGVNFTSDVFCGYNADVSIQDANVNLDGHTFTVTGDFDINAGGTLNVDAGSTLKIDQNNDLKINNGGTINIIGTSGNNATVTHYNPGRYDFFVNNGGTIGAEYATFEYMDSFGITIMPGGIVDAGAAFDNCVFQNGSPAYSSAYIVLNGSNTFTANNTYFENTSGNTGSNVWKSTNTGNATFQAATGDFAGPEFEGDTHNRINWTDMQVDLQMVAFLEGTYNGTDMDTDLRDAGLLPLSQPYNAPPWNYTGTETVGSIPANVVDWVLVELRDADSGAGATGATVIDTRAAFLLNDGKVVDLDGISSLQYTISYDKKLFPVIIHRNHLDVMAATNLVRDAAGECTKDFTLAGNAYGGGNAQKELSPGIWGMFGGDASGSNVIAQYDIAIWELVAGTSGYSGNDMDMNGQIDNNDKNDLTIPNFGEYSRVPN